MYATYLVISVLNALQAAIVINSPEEETVS